MNSVPKTPQQNGVSKRMKDSCRECEVEVGWFKTTKEVFGRSGGNSYIHSLLKSHKGVEKYDLILSLDRRKPHVSHLKWLLTHIHLLMNLKVWL